MPEHIAHRHSFSTTKHLSKIAAAGSVVPGKEEICQSITKKFNNTKVLSVRKSGLTKNLKIIC
jgi:hypothetical protein